MPSRAKSVSKTHHVQLTVPPDFQLPEFYGSATPEMVEEALHIGATLYLLVKSSTANEEMDRIEEEKGKQISHLKEQHAKKIQELEREMEKGQESCHAFASKSMVSVSLSRASLSPGVARCPNRLR